jgi:hypothetical protein
MALRELIDNIYNNLTKDVKGTFILALGLDPAPSETLRKATCDSLYFTLLDKGFISDGTVYPLLNKTLKYQSLSLVTSMLLKYQVESSLKSTEEERVKCAMFIEDKKLYERLLYIVDSKDIEKLKAPAAKVYHFVANRIEMPIVKKKPFMNIQYKKSEVYNPKDYQSMLVDFYKLLTKELKKKLTSIICAKRDITAAGTVETIYEDLKKGRITQTTNFLVSHMIIRNGDVTNLIAWLINEPDFSEATEVLMKFQVQYIDERNKNINQLSRNIVNHGIDLYLLDIDRSLYGEVRYWNARDSNDNLTREEFFKSFYPEPIRPRVEEKLPPVKQTHTLDIPSTNNSKEKSPKKQRKDDHSDFFYHLKEEKDDSCGICFETPKDTIIVDCGHFNYCGACLASQKICPTCRTPITKLTKVFQN